MYNIKQKLIQNDKTLNVSLFINLKHLTGIYLHNYVHDLLQINASFSFSNIKVTSIPSTAFNNIAFLNVHVHTRHHHIDCQMHQSHSFDQKVQDNVITTFIGGEFSKIMRTQMTKYLSARTISKKRRGRQQSPDRTGRMPGLIFNVSIQFKINSVLSLWEHLRLFEGSDYYRQTYNDTFNMSRYIAE